MFALFSVVLEYWKTQGSIFLGGFRCFSLQYSFCDISKLKKVLRSKNGSHYDVNKCSKSNLCSKRRTVRGGQQSLW